MEVLLRLNFPRGPIMIASIYRQWSGAAEEEDLQKLDKSIREFSSAFELVLILGDMNLDLARINAVNFYRRPSLIKLHLGCLEECGLNIANELDISSTFFSHGTFDNSTGALGQKNSVLDHVYYVGLSCPSFKVLPDAMTDHRPTLAGFDLEWKGSRLKMVKRRNFKSIIPSHICWAINAEALSRVFYLDDVDEMYKVIVGEITAALDLVAPLTQVQVKERCSPLYLAADTLTLMRRRDAATAKGGSQ